MEFSPIMEEKIILVVDDSSITRGLIEHIYKDKYKVMMASNWQGAMDIVDVMEESIIAILLDLNMPDVDGFDVLDYFRSKNIFDKILRTKKMINNYDIGFIDRLKKSNKKYISACTWVIFT